MNKRPSRFQPDVDEFGAPGAPLELPAAALPTGEAAQKWQKRYGRSLIGHLLLLACAAVVALAGAGWTWLAALALLGALGMRLWSGRAKARWQGARAFCERLGSSSWLFALAVKPFDGDTPTTTEQFEHAVPELTDGLPAGQVRPPRETDLQPTDDMLEIRSAPDLDRCRSYLARRLDEQARDYFAEKIRFNRSRAWWWKIIVNVVTGVVLGVLIVQAAIGWELDWAGACVAVLAVVEAWLASRRYAEVGEHFEATLGVLGQQRKTLDGAIKRADPAAGLAAAVAVEQTLVAEQRQWLGMMSGRSQMPKPDQASVSPAPTGDSSLARELSVDEAQELAATGPSFRRIGRVRARQLSGDLTWVTSRDSELHGSAGDWLITDGDSQWTVKESVFPTSYIATDQADVFERKGVVRAVELDEPVSVPTPEGISVGVSGDFLVLGEGDEVWPVPRKHFLSAYEPVDVGT